MRSIIRLFFYVFWLAVIVTAVAFAGLNAQSITVHYFFSQTTLSLPFLLVWVLLGGLLLGTVALFPYWIRSRIKFRSLKHHIRSLEQELINLRTMPVKDNR